MLLPLWRDLESVVLLCVSSTCLWKWLTNSLGLMLKKREVSRGRRARIFLAPAHSQLSHWDDHVVSLLSEGRCPRWVGTLSSPLCMPVHSVHWEVHGASALAVPPLLRTYSLLDGCMHNWLPEKLVLARLLFVLWWSAGMLGIYISLQERNSWILSDTSHLKGAKLIPWLTKELQERTAFPACSHGNACSGIQHQSSILESISG